MGEEEGLAIEVRERGERLPHLLLVCWAARRPRVSEVELREARDRRQPLHLVDVAECGVGSDEAAQRRVLLQGGQVVHWVAGHVQQAQTREAVHSGEVRQAAANQ